MNYKRQMFSMIVLMLGFFYCAPTFGQSGKIIQYKKWKSIVDELEQIQKNGAIFLRVQNYDNAKNYIESYYDYETVKLYSEKLEEYSATLEDDAVQGFSFSSLYIFDSGESKYVHNNRLNEISFRDGSTDSVYHFSKDVPHLFIELKDFGLAKRSNPLNFSITRIFQVLDKKMQFVEELDINESFVYHEKKDEENCPHILEASKRISLALETLLKNGQKKVLKLERKIKAKHQEKIKEYQKKIDLMEAEKEKESNLERKKRISELIEANKTKIQEIKRTENTLF